MPRHHAGMYKAPTGTSGTGVARTVAALRSARNADRHQLFTAARNIQPDSPIIDDMPDRVSRRAKLQGWQQPENLPVELCGKGGTPRLARRRPLRVSQPLQKAATTTTEGSGSSTPSPSAETRAAVNLSAIFHSDDQSAALVADLIANLDVTSASTVPPAPAAAAVAATSSAIITSELTDAQVAAITQDGPLDPARPTVSVMSFTQKLQQAQARMMGLCARWTTLLPEAEAVSAEAAEEIRAAIGQADLLIRKKLIKFMDLCTAAQQPGTTTTAADLEGYWEACVVPPIAEVDARFDKCDDLKGQGWQPTPRQPEPPAPRKRSIKLASRKARNSAGSSTGAGAPAAAAAAPKARSSTLSFLAEARERRRLALLQQSSEQQDIDVVVAVPIKRHAQPMDMEDACAEPMARRALPVSSGSGCSAGASRTSFGGIVVPHGNVLLTPVRPPKHEASEPAGEVYVTPVRRSARKAASKFRTDVVEAEMAVEMLGVTDVTLQPNTAMMVRISPSPAAALTAAAPPAVAFAVASSPSTPAIRRSCSRAQATPHTHLTPRSVMMDAAVTPAGAAAVPIPVMTPLSSTPNPRSRLSRTMQGAGGILVVTPPPLAAPASTVRRSARLQRARAASNAGPAHAKRELVSME